MVLDDMLHIDLIPNNMYLKTIAMSPLYIDKMIVLDLILLNVVC